MIPVHQQWLETNVEEAQERLLVWLDCHVGASVNVEFSSGSWAFEASGKLKTWQGRGGLYLVGGSAVLDVSSLGEVEKLQEGVEYGHPEQIVVSFESGIASMAVTVLEL
jgi:hypothetical protein